MQISKTKMIDKQIAMMETQKTMINAEIRYLRLP